MNSPILFDWMRPLGWALLHFLWQGTLIALLLAFVLGLLRNARPQVRGRAALMALLVMAVCPALTAWYYRNGTASSLTGEPEFDRRALPPPLHSQAAIAMEFPDTEPGDGASPPARIRPATKTAMTSPPPAGASTGTGWMPRITALMPWGVWVWLGGVSLLALWRLGGWIQIGRWMRHGVSPAPHRWTAVLRELMRESGLRRPVRLMASLKVAVPVTAGWLRPVILFPASLLSGLPPRHVEALLAHELAHIRRMDYLVNLAQTALETLLFYHPAVWWTGRIIRQEREHCCDDAAVALHGDMQGYARALAGLVGLVSAPALLPAARGGSLLLRLRRLLTPQSASGPALRIPASMAAAGAVLSLAFLFMNTPAGVAEGKPVAPVESLTAIPSPSPAIESPDKKEEAVESQVPDRSTPSASVSPLIVAAAPAARGRILDRNGVVLAGNDASGHRQYPGGALAAHAIGYVTDTGKAGVEANFEKVLAAGKDVSLTLDARIQEIVEQAMQDAGVGRGAVVVLDPQDAGILAMASFPDYDPGVFSGGVDAKEIKRLESDQTLPMVNRAVLPDFPGSTYKIVTAAALCRAGKGGQQFSCPGFIDYGRPIACWIYAQAHGSHGGPFPLATALKYSCNCWFFQAGNLVGIDKLAETARLMELDAATSDIFESRPVTIIDKKWWSENKPGPWTQAETAYASIGTEIVQESPLHMASVAATIASRGDVWKPRLNKDTPAACTQKQILSEKQIAPILEGMRLVVNDRQGVGQQARSSQFTIAGKTGTAQKERRENGRRVEDNRAWFIAFAPYENPRYALSVLVENGQAGGKVSAPIAKKILEQAMALKEGPPFPAPQRREPVRGHFRVPGQNSN